MSSVKRKGRSFFSGGPGRAGLTWTAGLLCGWLVGLAVPWTDALAWTQEDLEAAERLLDRKLEAQRAAKVKAAAEAKAKAEAEAAAMRRTLERIANDMVQIPGGSFRMGCSPGDSDCAGDEKPPHTVKVAAFRLGKYEVTQAQWQTVTGANPSRFKGDDRPVENVSWDDIQAFLKRLNAGTNGKPYRLPTEAEWEYAARAGSKTPYWWGASIGQGNANCNGCGSRWDGKETAPVGSFKPNAFGLHDTVGNVWEWVQDCYHQGYIGAPSDGSESHFCIDARRVLRGGSWNNNLGIARVSDRGGVAPRERLTIFGLRLAQDL